MPTQAPMQGPTPIAVGKPSPAIPPRPTPGREDTRPMGAAPVGTPLRAGAASSAGSVAPVVAEPPQRAALQSLSPTATLVPALMERTTPAAGLTDALPTGTVQAEQPGTGDATSSVRSAEPAAAEAAPRAVVQILTPAGVSRPVVAALQASALGTRPGRIDATTPPETPRPQTRTASRAGPGPFERGLDPVSEAVSGKIARDSGLPEEPMARDTAPLPSPLSPLRAAFEPSLLSDSNASQGSSFSLPPAAVADAAGTAQTDARAPVREAPSRESWMRFEDLQSQFGGEIRKASLETDGTGRAALRIMLAPENMGTIEAEVIESNNTVTINIVAQTEEVVRVLRENSHALREAFSGHSATEINIFRDTGGSGAQHAGGRQPGGTSTRPESATDSSAAGASAVDAASADPTPAQLDTYV